MEKVVIEITGERASEAADIFIGWFLDGGGEQNFMESCSDEGLEVNDDYVFNTKRLA